MIIVTPELILAVNAAILVIAGILALLLLRTGTLYVRNIGDSPIQEAQKKIILVLIIFLLITSILAAAFNILTTPI